MTAAQYALLLEQVQTRARDIKPAQVALIVVSAPFLALGWLAAHLFAAVWIVIAWAIGAVVTGWKFARDESPPGQ